MRLRNWQLSTVNCWDTRTRSRKYRLVCTLYSTVNCWDTRTRNRKHRLVCTLYSTVNCWDTRTRSTKSRLVCTLYSVQYGKLLGHQSAKLKKIIKLATIPGFLKPGFGRVRVSCS